MMYYNKHVGVEILQNKPDYSGSCTVLMVLPYQLSSNKKFRKLPS